MNSITLDKMSTEEKIQIMEEIWVNLCNQAESLTSPKWHQTELSQREKAIQTGHDEFLDWGVAKNQINKHIS